MDYFLLGAFLLVVLGVLIGSPRRRRTSGTKYPGRSRQSIARTPVVEVTMSYGTRVQGKPSTSDACWVRPGREKKIGPWVLEGGMVYVGRNLPSIGEWQGVEPALVDPSLPRDDRRPDDSGAAMGYWPSYADIPPQCRSGFLGWLAGGRVNPDAYIGYVFLFFYGLERRALHDVETSAEARNELPQIIAETERLLSIYGDNRSFRGYASGLLDVLRARQNGSQLKTTPPAIPANSSQLPLMLRAGIAQFAKAGTPLPSAWALAWATNDPEMGLRTPAVRCRQEFEALFETLYRDRHGPGLRLKTCKRQIRADYRPASASFGRAIEEHLDLPDVTSLVGPTRRIQEIVTECSDALDPFSRWLGRNPDGRESLTAAAILPAELLDDFAPAAFADLRETLDRRLGAEEATLIPAASVLADWLPEDGRKQTKKSGVEAAQLFAHAGFGLEPDVRFGGARLCREDQLVLYRLGTGEHETPTAAYGAAALLLDLAAIVAAADGDVSAEEEAYLRDHVAAGLLLDDAEQRRLAAHLRWLLAQPPGTAGVKKRIESMTVEQRRQAGRFLVGVTCADGHIDPGEVKSLTKIYGLLGLDPGAVHHELHAVAGAAPPSGPVQVAPADDTERGYAIPEQPRPVARDAGTRIPAATTSGSELDMRTVHAKLAESAVVARMLGDIFEEEDPVPEPVVSSVDRDDDAERVHGMDAPHSMLLRSLGERPEWAREEYESLADTLGLMADAALGVLNDIALEICDELLTDGDDPIRVRKDIFQEMLA